jgi:uncharacterized protein YbcC (UPF0753/DUF2309 family)
MNNDTTNTNKNSAPVSNDALKAFNNFVASNNYSAPMIHSLVQDATDVVPISYNLNNFVADNPLRALDKLNFHTALAKAKQLFKANVYPEWSESFAKHKSGLIKDADLADASTKHLSEKADKELQIANQKLELGDLYWFLIHFDKAKLEDLKSTLSAKDIETLEKIVDERYASSEFECASSNFFPVSNEVANGEIEAKINDQMIKFCMAFFDEGLACWKMPQRKKGFYKAWKALTAHDSTFPINDSVLKNNFKQLPDTPEEAIVYCLILMGIEEHDWQDYIKATLATLPGWSGYIKWRINKPDYRYNTLAPASLTEFVAVRLVAELFYLIDYKKAYNEKQIFFEGLEQQLRVEREKLYLEQRKAEDKKDLVDINLILAKYNAKFNITRQSILPQEQLGLLSAYQYYLSNEPKVWLEAEEYAYQRELVSKVNSVDYNKIAESKKADAQMIFCIDVRSEAIRRAIEAQGNYDTLGFAGFFALPIKYQGVHDHDATDSCPVLLRPKYLIKETVKHECKDHDHKHENGYNFFKQLNKIYYSLKTNSAPSFMFAEASGPFFGLGMLAKTFLPRMTLKAQNQLKKMFLPDDTVYVADPGYQKRGLGIPVKEQAEYAAASIKLMGFKYFAPVVLLCGHGSTTENNPYASALDCGACAGNHGGPNARVMAHIFNNHDVRDLLKEKGIEIPKDTVFLAAQHDTTTDDFKIYSEEHDLSSEAKARVAKIDKDLKAAKEVNAHYRLGTMGDQSMDPELRSQNWSEARPEWGLAKNSCFIIAPRTLTEEMNLEAKSFLHSYDYAQDPNGDLLFTIMTAPMVVTQMINAQYYFSTVDNNKFGSGNKITQNIVGKIGVMQGNASDLMTGLSLQSVRSTDTENYHDAKRLQVMIHAPRTMVEGLIAKADVLQRLFFNEWLKLIILDPTDKCLYKLEGQNNWIRL